MSVHLRISSSNINGHFVEGEALGLVDGNSPSQYT